MHGLVVYKLEVSVQKLMVQYIFYEHPHFDRFLYQYFQKIITFVPSKSQKNHSNFKLNS